MVLDVGSKEVFGKRQSEKIYLLGSGFRPLSESELFQTRRGPNRRADVSYLIKWKDGSPPPRCLLSQ